MPLELSNGNTLSDEDLGALMDEMERIGSRRAVTGRPKVVCLCGSTRFSKAYQEANFNETLEGNIVLTIGCDLKSDHELFADKSPQQMAGIKMLLDDLHLRKIDLADEILVLNVGGYIGDSTKLEIAYAKMHGKGVRYLEPVE